MKYLILPLLILMAGCSTPPRPAPKVVEIPPDTKVIIIREVPYYSTWGIGVGWEWGWYRHGPLRHGRRW